MSKNLPARLDDGIADASVFLEQSGIPSFVGPVLDIYEYVEKKAREVGENIKHNRGVPPGASRENMLTPEEKALGILGYALGIPAKEIVLRINHLRVTRNEDPVTSLNDKIFHDRHRSVVAAIQQDAFESMEVASPLVIPRQRIAWRANMLEYYRTKIMEIVMNPDREVTEGDTDSEGQYITIKEHRAIAKLDAAMQPHLKFFDRLAVDPDFAGKLAPPSEQVRKAHEAEKAAEKRIQDQFDKGEITDERRIELLRELRHGREDVPDDE